MKNPWYKDGICFTCKQCGNCCSGSPGYVFLSEEDIVRIANFFHISSDDVKRKYCRFSKNRWALLEKSDYDCIFLRDRKCQIYSARPIQCQTFPFWPDLLQSKEHFTSIACYCKGLYKAQYVHSLEEIQKALNAYLQNFS